MISIIEFIQYECINIDLDIFDLLYDVIQNETWVYLSGEIIHDYFGYKKTNVSLRDFNKKMKANYKDNIDYKEVDKNHEMVQKYKMVSEKKNVSNKYGGGSNKKYYIISSKTLVLCLTRANTKQAIRTLEYFYEIHYLLTKYNKYQINQLKLDYMTELDKLRNMDHNKTYTVEQTSKYEVDGEILPGYVYFVNEVSDFDYFKIGFTTNDIDERLQQLQCGNRRRLTIYKFIECDDPCKLENKLHQKYNSRKVLNEWFKITIDEIDKCVIKYSSNDTLNNIMENLVINN